MKILSIFEEGKLGGPQIYLVNLVSGYDKSDDIDNVIIFPIANSERFKDLITYRSIEYVRLPITRITKEILVALRYILAFWLEIVILRNQFKKQKPDLVYVAGGSWQFKGVIAAKLASFPVIWHLNDTGMPRFIRFVFGFLSKYSDGFVFASERSKSYYGPLIRSYGPQFVIPSSVDTEWFNPNLDFSLVIKKARVDACLDHIVIGMVANISRVKGLETFIRMAAEANVNQKNLKFVVVGPIFPNQQNYYDSLCDLASELGVTNIEFVGGHEDVRPLLKRFDIYVCSSNAESSPISVWEAMAMELPIVSTDVGDVPLYVKEGKTGYIVPVGDHEALAGFVCKLSADEALRERLGKSGRVKVSEELDIKACVEKHLEAYHTVLGEN